LPETSPINKILQLKEQGQSNTDIIRILQEQGFSFQQISEALNHAQTKQTIETQPQAAPTEMQPSVLYDKEQPPAQEATINAPTPSPAQPQAPVFSTEVEPQFWPEQNSISSQALGSTTEDIEEIAESIIGEKWQKVTEELGDVTAWKEKTSSDLESIKQEIMRVENRFENLQNSVLGKVKEYDQSVSDVSVEIKALGKLLSNIVTPLTSNVKQLESLIKDLKK
jgi:DNA-binding transcriptional MerR regulator